jgi:hypothetical protein
MARLIVKLFAFMLVVLLLMQNFNEASAGVIKVIRLPPKPHTG